MRRNKIQNPKSKIQRIPQSVICNSKWNGFSLTEVLVALTVFAIGLLSLVLLFPHGMAAANQTNCLSIATLLAQQKMEDVKRDGTLWVAGTNQGPIQFPLESRFQWTVKVVAGGGTTRLVTVTVTWDTNRSYELQTSI
jgi:prepilin-type N-terminal cleavage/methylation domain-containing protein